MQDEETELCVRMMGLVQVAWWKPRVSFALSFGEKNPDI